MDFGFSFLRVEINLADSINVILHTDTLKFHAGAIIEGFPCIYLILDVLKFLLVTRIAIVVILLFIIIIIYYYYLILLLL